MLVRGRIDRMEHVGGISRCGLRDLRQPLAVTVLRIHLGFHRQADLQRMRGEFLRVERNAYWNALDHLDPVAGGILRRQQREGRAGTGAKTGNLAVVCDLAAVDIGNELDRLTDAHRRELRLLEVGVDPHLVERDDRHQRRTGAHALSELHRALGDKPTDRGGQHCSGFQQEGLAHFRRRILHVGVILDRRAIDARAIDL